MLMDFVKRSYPLAQTRNRTLCVLLVAGFCTLTPYTWVQAQQQPTVPLPASGAAQPVQVLPSPGVATPANSVTTPPDLAPPAVPTTAQLTPSTSTTQDPIEDFVLQTAAQHQLDRDWVRTTLANAQHMPRIKRLVLPPPKDTPKNWQQYRSRFIDETRIQAGQRFWRQNQATLARAEQTFGVPANIIVGIIGVETVYGQVMGNVRVLDALYTLAFDFPTEHPRAAERQAFFRAELGHFLALAQQERRAPESFTGSFAGAMGLPQFMPSSWRKYAVDFDGDGRIDLINNPVDAIGSVANYFKAFGWHTGMPTHFNIITPTQTESLDTLLAPDILPTFTPASMMAKGAILPPEALKQTGQLALIELQNGGNAPTYYAGTDNFYVITRYNWSSYYAKSVIDLAEEVSARMP